METKTEKYAIIHKTQCCVAWEKTHQVIEYETDGIVTMPDWYGWSGSDNLPDVMPISEFRAGGCYEEQVKDVTVPEEAQYGAFDYQSGEFRFWNSEQEAAQNIWDFGICSDWAYSLYTPQEAIDELVEDKFWLDEYKEYVIDQIQECEDFPLDEYEFTLDGFIDYVLTESKSGSKNNCLAEIAQNK